jgi:hypothetical protein
VTNIQNKADSNQQLCENQQSGKEGGGDEIDNSEAVDVNLKTINR